MCALYNTTAPLQRQIAVFPFDFTFSAGLPACEASGTLPKKVMEGEPGWPVKSRVPVLYFNMIQKWQSLIGDVVSRTHEAADTIANCCSCRCEIDKYTCVFYLGKF